MATRLLLSTLLLLFAPGCSGEPGEPGGKVRAFVSVPPQAYFVERVGGPHVEVEALVAPGQSPHTFEPAPRQMAKLSEAQVYFGIGVPFEKTLLEKIEGAFKRLRVVDTRAGAQLRAMTAPHEHGGEPDPHLWLNPRLVKIMAADICASLKDLDPAHARDYEANLRAFLEDLDELDSRIAAALTPLAGREFFVYHGAFSYFAHAYGLKQVAVQIGGKEPGAKRLAALIERAKKGNVRVIFVQPQFSTASAEAVAGAIGAKVVAIDPLAKDYLKNLEETARKITEALGGRWPQGGQGE